jgi:hypothetical protein
MDFDDEFLLQAERYIQYLENVLTILFSTRYRAKKINREQNRHFAFIVKFHISYCTRLR